MIYKIKIDTRKAIESLNKLGITRVDQENLFFFVNAENPDDACHIALNKLKTKVKYQYYSRTSPPEEESRV